MELVPILSTIILVGTIATFILAVAAYILYKIRERRAHEQGSHTIVTHQEPHVLVAPQPAAVLAASQPQQTSIHVTPSPTPVQQPSTTVVVEQPAQPAVQPQSSLFWEYTDEGFVPVRPGDPEPADRESSRTADDEGYAWL